MQNKNNSNTHQKKKKSQNWVKLCHIWRLCLRYRNAKYRLHSRDDTYVGGSAKVHQRVKQSTSVGSVRGLCDS